LLVVVAMLGILAAITVFTVRGTSASGEERACAADEQTVERAADYYLAQNQVDVIPATGAGPDRFEQTLVDAQLLKSTSSYFDLAEDGTVTATGDPCP
jgi:general secretion pathway protein G